MSIVGVCVSVKQSGLGVRDAFIAGLVLPGSVRPGCPSMFGRLPRASEQHTL